MSLALRVIIAPHNELTDDDSEQTSGNETRRNRDEAASLAPGAASHSVRKTG